jgi:sugar lactone lactonase YvrE
MRKLLVSMIVALFLASLFVSSAVAAKIKHRGSVYMDKTGMALNQPEGVACSDKYFIVADTGNSQLVRYSLTDQTMVPEVTFPLEKISPIIAEINTKGEIYLLDGKTRTVVKVSQNGQVKGRVVPKGVPGSKTYMPRSFKLDEDDNLYLLDIFAERVLVLDAADKYVRHLPFPEGSGSFSDLAISDQGSIYILNGVSGSIYVAIPGAKAFELLSGDLKEHMNFPTNIAIDSNGVLYLSDQYGSGLALVGRDGSFQGRKFGMGWEEGQLYYPSQLCINDQDTLFVADKNNSRVQVFNILND